MKSFFMRHPKEKLISLIIGFVVYLTLQILSATVLSGVYTFGWMAGHLYCYTWVAVILLIAFDQPLLSYFVTFGNVCGTIVGELLGGLIRERRMSEVTSDMTVEEIELRRIHYGVLIWLITLAVFIIVGIAVKIAISRKTRPVSA